MTAVTSRIRPGLLFLGAVTAALGLVVSLTSVAHAIDYEGQVSSWSSGNDAGGRDASARLVSAGGNVHYRALFRANNEVLHVYDYYNESPHDRPAQVEWKIREPDNDYVIGREGLVYHDQGHGSEELDVPGWSSGGLDVPEGYKIQFRVCVHGGSCTGWAYGRA